MIFLIAGPSHTGKTLLAQRLLEKYRYPYLSIDHLKMGLIRSGYTDLTPVSSEKALTEYLWPAVREIIKTAVENSQNLIVEGCYIPFDWAESFDEEYLRHIRYCCLIMSEAYIRSHFCDIKEHANAIEKRGDDSDCTIDTLIRDNREALKLCRMHQAKYFLIDGVYGTDIEF
ncbi:MAG: adenylate kinase [Oscillospiraceae bacterium]|nr:adenylate kinase [Oscillospiraceae bacterium]